MRKYTAPNNDSKFVVRPQHWYYPEQTIIHEIMATDIIKRIEAPRLLIGREMQGVTLMFYDKGSYATLGNFPSVK